MTTDRHRRRSNKGLSGQTYFWLVRLVNLLESMRLVINKVENLRKKVGSSVSHRSAFSIRGTVQPVDPVRLSIVSCNVAAPEPIKTAFNNAFVVLAGEARECGWAELKSIVECIKYEYAIEIAAHKGVQTELEQTSSNIAEVMLTDCHGRRGNKGLRVETYFWLVGLVNRLELIKQAIYDEAQSGKPKNLRVLQERSCSLASSVTYCSLTPIPEVEEESDSEDSD